MSASLFFDTSGDGIIAALSANGKTISRQDLTPRGQAERLIPLLNDLLEEAGVSWHDLSYAFCLRGPGSFTGIRVALSTLRGLALAAPDMKAFALCRHNLAALYFIASASPKEDFSVLQSTGRDDFYVADYGHDGNMRGDITVCNSADNRLKVSADVMPEEAESLARWAVEWVNDISNKKLEAVIRGNNEFKTDINFLISSLSPIYIREAGITLLETAKSP